MKLSEEEILQCLMRSRTRVSAAAWVVVSDSHAAEDIFQNVALKAMTRDETVDVMAIARDVGPKVLALTEKVIS